MVYFTTKQPASYHQMTLEEMLFGTYNGPLVYNANGTATITNIYDGIPDHIRTHLDLPKLIAQLEKFNATTEDLHNVERGKLYDTFYIPKKSGGLRRIDAPRSELMNALRDLKGIFEADFGALYHTSAFAYIKGRCTIDAVKKHQSNESRWFAKLDLHNFFGSTTPEFVTKMLSMIYPFSEVFNNPHGREEITKALDLAFLNGGLPQGTPISPLITNLMMIPIDHKLANMFRDFESQRFVYTRYADDFIISSQYTFKIHEVEAAVTAVLAQFGAPFNLNTEKTRYGSSAGRNWNLGVMLNKDNVITVGHKKKRAFQSMLHNYIEDRKKHIEWELNDLQTLMGLYSYYHMVEGDVIDAIVAHINRKNSVDVIRMLKLDLG